MRFTVAFEGEAAETLERLANRRGSKADVLRDALGLEREYQEARDRKAEVLIREQDGTLTRLIRL